MKLSLRKATSFALAAGLLALVAGCGDTAADELEAGHPPPPSAPPASAPAPGPSPRGLVDLNALPTSPVNLLLDPGFGLVGEQASYGSFLAFNDGTYRSFDLKVTFDSRSPAGFGGAVARIEPPGATDTRSNAVTILTSVPGGAGPFRAQIWVSKTTVKGEPAAIALGEDGITASLADGTPNGKAYDLEPVADATRTSGAHTWTLLRATIDKALPYGAFFLVHTGNGGGFFRIAAPEIVAQPLVAAVPTRGFGRAVTARAMTATERAVIERYRAIPPRLVPAAPKPRAGL